MYKDLRQTERHSNYMRAIGWKVDKFSDIYIYSKKLLFWKFVKIQRLYSLNANSLLRYIGKRYRYSTIYIEPSSERQYQDLLKIGFREYNSPFLPSKTIQLDLTKSESELLNKMHYKTRYNIKHNSKLKNKKTNVNSNKNEIINVSETKDIEKFAVFWQVCAKKRGMFLSQKGEIKAIYNAFGKDACIHVAYQDDNWLAGILRISSSDISYYMYAAATNFGKKMFAPTILTWEAIKSAKREGKKIFDFEGIYDERYPLKSWKGFSRFKKGFGGKEVEYPGCVSKIII